MENAEKEKFELAVLDEYVVLFTCARIDRKTVPEDFGEDAIYAQGEMEVYEYHREKCTFLKKY